MKKILICLLTLFVFSCSINDDSPYIYSDLLPIESVELPEVFQFGQTYQIPVTYIQPTNCHSFSGIYYLKNGDERIVAIINQVVDGGNCTDAGDSHQVSFNFMASQMNTYIFKFWQGVDENGEDTYLIYEVPVEQ